jgi:outer membrane lipoprotein-sorting protein
MRISNKEYRTPNTEVVGVQGLRFKVQGFWGLGIVAVLLLMTVACFGQYPGYKAVSDLDGFKQKFTAGSEKIQTVASQFTQEKTLVALTEKITSQGKFWFKRSNKVRIEYIKPFTYLMVMNGDKVLLRDGTKENRVNTQSNRLFQQVNRIMIDCMQGTVLTSKDFTARVFEDNSSYLLELTPTGKALKSFFATVVLVVEKNDYSVRSMEMNEAGGDKTTLVFTDKKLNTPVDDSTFTF